MGEVFQEPRPGVKFMNNFWKSPWGLSLAGILLIGLNPVWADSVDFHPLDESATGTNPPVVYTSLGGPGVYPAPYPDTLAWQDFAAITTNLNGAGIRVAQVEAPNGSGTAPSYFEVNPATVGQPESLFTYYYSSRYVSTVFPNSIGGESGHADNVAADFYGSAYGLAPGVSHVDNFDASSFAGDYVASMVAVPDRVVNQSYTAGQYRPYTDFAFDTYADLYNVIFVTGAGDAGANVASPATCFNGIAVGIYNSTNPPYGPSQGGRCKPDITAWGNQEGATSFSVPMVSGAATLLLQAGERGDGGTNTAAVTDLRTVKALLLNGAVKPADWTNSPANPLHTIYGAGMLNLLNSYEQLTGGQTPFASAELTPQGTPLVPPATPPQLSGTDTAGLLRGWDFNTITNDGADDGVNDYYFAVTNCAPGASYTFTATLTWDRQAWQWEINNLALYLYDVASGNVISCSTSLADNVQHIYVPSLPPGVYDLQVWSAAGGPISPTETYGLAYEFYSQSLHAAVVGTNVVVTWPLYPSGFALQGATNLTSAATWVTLTNTLKPVIAGNQYQFTLPAIDPAAVTFQTETNVITSTGPFPGSGSVLTTNVSIVETIYPDKNLHFFRLVRPNR
jgi:Subtilase family